MTSLLLSPAAPFKAVDLSFLPLTAIVVAVVGGLYVTFVYLFDPLKGVPSIHWAAPLSDCYNLYLNYTDRRRVILYDAHSGRQGQNQSQPILRVGPKEVSIMTNEGLRIAYGGGFVRSSWYEVFKNFG